MRLPDLETQLNYGLAAEKSRTTHMIPHVLLTSFAILSTLSLAVLTVSARASSEMDTLIPAAAIPTTEATMLNGSAMMRQEEWTDVGKTNVLHFSAVPGVLLSSSRLG